MTELESFNQIRALLGLPPINSTETQSRSVAVLRDSLNRAKKRIFHSYPQKFGYETTLLPIDGQIGISQFLRVIYPKTLENKLTERNGVIWNASTNAPHNESIAVVVIEDTAFEQIDSHAWQEFITLEAAIEMAQRTNDVDNNFAVIVQQRNIAQKKAAIQAKLSGVGFLGSDSALRGFFS